METSTEKQRMEQLIQTLRAAARAYYQESRELMSNYEYDALYDELEQLEKKTGIVLAGSPTQRVGYEVVSELPKEEHPAPIRRRMWQYCRAGSVCSPRSCPGS